MNNWQTKKLGEIIELHYGKGLDRSYRKSDGDFPVFGANGELGRTDKFLAEGEAVIVGRKGSAGEVTRISGKFWPSDVAYYVFGNDQIDVDYLFKFFKLVDLTQFARGVKPGINRNEVYSIEIPLPPLETQKEIVAKLDEKFVKLREAKRMREEAIVDTEKILSTTLREIFEEGKEKGWEEKTLDSVCLKTETINWKENKEKTFEYIDLSSVSRETFSISETQQVTASNAPSRARKLLQNNDVIFGTTRPTLMRVTVIPEEYDGQICSTGFCVLRANPEKILPSLIFYFIQSHEFMDRMEKIQTGASYPAVSDSKVLETVIALPPLAEQKEIVTRLDTLSSKLRTLRELQQSQLADLKRLEKAYLQEAFKGELI